MLLRTLCRSVARLVQSLGEVGVSPGRAALPPPPEGPSRLLCILCNVMSLGSASHLMFMRRGSCSRADLL
eukprot:2468709-Pyramimonas_sp.AAC.1